MVRCRPFTHAAPTREADLPVKFHAKNTPALPANRKGQSGKVLLCPQQDNLATSVAHFCIAVLTMIVAARARGFSPVDDNEADAIAVLMWALETKGGVA